MAMMIRERRLRAFLFGLFGLVPIFLVGRLGFLQVLQAGELNRPGRTSPLRLTPRAADLQRERRDSLPSPRGTLLDRYGATLAIDSDAFEVRADVHLPRPKKAEDGCKEARLYLADLVEQLSDALSRDPGLADRALNKKRHRACLQERVNKAFGLDALPASGELPKGAHRKGEFLVDSEVAVPSVIEALDDLDEAKPSLHLQMLRIHIRTYPERELTYGLVGYMTDKLVRDPQNSALVSYQPVASLGLEGLAALHPGEPGERIFHVDSGGRRYYAGPRESAAMPSRVVTTIDLELQKIASRLLEDQANAVGVNGKSLPQWGALVLIEMATGDVLAAASWHRDAKSPKGAACAPYQLVYEPGSIVKPLVFAYALQNAGLDWNHLYDCSSVGGDNHRVVEETGRMVRDDHRCGELTPHLILVNSSNIGAVKVGSRITREQWRDYLDVFGIGKPLGIDLAHEQNGGIVQKSFSPRISVAAFKRWTGSSYSFGYEMQVNAMQVGRAFLSMLTGCKRELRLVRSIEVDGHLQAAAVKSGDRFLDPPVVDAIRAAMVDVVSDAEHATCRYLVQNFHKEGIELNGLIAGKTGTAASRSTIKGKGTVEVRNASFVGFAPAAAPRYLVVCVLQKDNGAAFYGSSYAAPPAARLLLEAMRLEERRRLCLEPQVSASPGASGRSYQAPETSQVGR